MTKPPSDLAASEKRTSQPAAGLDGLKHLSQRLERVLLDERECLRSASFDALERIIARKDQLAVELSRFIASNSGLTPDVEIRSSLTQMAAGLNVNAALLKRHIEAVSEIAGLISDIVSGANSDGTYSSNVARRRSGA